MDSPFVREPPIFTAYFAFTDIFAVISFGQLVLVLLLTCIKRTRKPLGDAFGTVTEQVGLPRFHRERFALLMTLMLALLIIAYSSLAAFTFLSSSLRKSYVAAQRLITITTTYDCTLELQNAFLFAVLVAVLDSGIKVSQLCHFSSVANSMQGGTNVNIIMMSCLVGFLMILTVARIAVICMLNANPTVFVSNATLAAENWAQFGLFQVRVFIDLVLAIYFTVVAILMWRKKHMVPHEPKKTDNNDSFRALERIVKYVCPLLILLTIHMIIFDVVGNTIITSIIVQHNILSYDFAYTFSGGLIIILLNLALISVGYVL